MKIFNACLFATVLANAMKTWVGGMQTDKKRQCNYLPSLRESTEKWPLKQMGGLSGWRTSTWLYFDTFAIRNSNWNYHTNLDFTRRSGSAYICLPSCHHWDYRCMPLHSPLECGFWDLKPGLKLWGQCISDWFISSSLYSS